MRKGGPSSCLERINFGTLENGARDLHRVRSLGHGPTGVDTGREGPGFQASGMEVGLVGSKTCGFSGWWAPGISLSS